MRKILALAGGLVIAAATATPALADVPSNDEIGGATVITPSPVTPTANAASLQQSADGATSNPTDPFCGEGPTLWWSYTPTRDEFVRVGADSATPIALGVYQGPTDSILQLSCDFTGLNSAGQTVGPARDFDATAGVTYYFMASQVAGDVTISLFGRPAPTPVTDVTVTPQALTLVDGVPRLTVTLVCDANGWADLLMSVEQIKGKRSSNASTEELTFCSTEPRTFTTSLATLGDPLRRGEVTFRAVVYAGTYTTLGFKKQTVREDFESVLRLTR